MPDERTPLLRTNSAPQSGPAGNAWPTQDASTTVNLNSQTTYLQYCSLIGIRPHTLKPDQDFHTHNESLYSRATRQKRIQNVMYQLTAAFANTLILSQVVIGAALIFAGIIAFLKSRGQPMRSRMFRDDLDRVVDEMEDSAIMFLGIDHGAHGYDAIDTEDQVTVRGEVARLTRLYDRAVKLHQMNDPDMYSTGAPGDPHSAALKDRTGQPVPAPPPPTAAPSADAVPAPPAPGPAVSSQDPDASPATNPPEPPKSEPEPAPDSKSAEEQKSAAPAEGPSSSVQPDMKTNPVYTAGESANAGSASTSTPAIITATPAVASLDPDQSPATAIHPKKHSQDTSKTDEDKTSQ